MEAQRLRCQDIDPRGVIAWRHEIHQLVALGRVVHGGDDQVDLALGQQRYAVRRDHGNQLKLHSERRGNVHRKIGLESDDGARGATESERLVVGLCANHEHSARPDLVEGVRPGSRGWQKQWCRKRQGCREPVPSREPSSKGYRITNRSHAGHPIDRDFAHAGHRIGLFTNVRLRLGILRIFGLRLAARLCPGWVRGAFYPIAQVLAGGSGGMHWACRLGRRVSARSSRGSG